MKAVETFCRQVSTRAAEPHFTHTPFVAEWWNTLSNLPFVVIGLCRLWAGTPIVGLYTLFTAAGLCSAYHHAHPEHWTLVIDWMPIATSGLLCLWFGVVTTITAATLFKVALAFAVLVTDNFLGWPMPVPWGHVMWHVLAAYSIDSAYCDYAGTL